MMSAAKTNNNGLAIDYACRLSLLSRDHVRQLYVTLTSASCDTAAINRSLECDEDKLRSAVCSSIRARS